MQNLENTTGSRLWEKAKTIIPGGNQLLSKRAERFLPGLWPSYYSQAKGCEITDLDGRRFIDFAQMGVGSCILGYADDDVNAAVVEAIRLGNMSTLNCREEVDLTELLLELHPWADMARYARSGGEACAIAVRIARAAAGKSGVAFCGYHGWHDWYIAANLGDSAGLDDHLLPGLLPGGVPRALKGTAHPFEYNNLSSLQNLMASKGDEIGVIIMEPERNSAPDPAYLRAVREIATRYGAVLIFDEVTSGFRMNCGGIHLLHGTDPDLAVFGKGMSNGFPLSAVLGRREVMEHALDTFISSTYWTERIGFTAALATLAKFRSHDVASHLIGHGRQIIDGLEALAGRHDLPLRITGIEPLIYLRFDLAAPGVAQTYFAQEMLARGFLAGGAIYTTYAYTREIIENFLLAAGGVFENLMTHHRRGTLENQLKGEVVHAGFKRLT
jgi:glutamate-1-semialdehyde 2,1-aminomutase